MPTLQSTQIAAEAADVVTDWKRPGLNLRRIVCTANFSWTADAAQNDLIQLCRLPIGARIIDAEIDFTAFGASVTLDIGDGTTEDLYLAAADVSSAGNARFAHTVALKGLLSTELTVSTIITAKLEGANPDSGTLQGRVTYAIEDN